MFFLQPLVDDELSDAVGDMIEKRLDGANHQLGRDVECAECHPIFGPGDGLVQIHQQDAKMRTTQIESLSCIQF